MTTINTMLTKTNSLISVKVSIFVIIFSLIIMLPSCAGEEIKLDQSIRDGVIYKLDNDNKTAFAVGYVNVGNNLMEINIPSTFKAANIEYKVIAIENKAFAKTGITKCYIGSNVMTIGENAFAGCYNLDTVVVTGSFFPTLWESAFDETTYKNAMLVIPLDLAPQQKYTNWGLFANTEILH